MAHILIVDDEYNIRMMLRLALQQEGHTVEVAADGNEGLERFGNGARWDLVLLDQRMPGMEGLTVLQHMRDQNPEARILMITAFGTVDLAVAAMKAGATDFLRKPFTAETLRGAVRVALQNTPVATAGSDAPPQITFGTTTINGFRIEFTPGSPLSKDSEGVFSFHVLPPNDTPTDVRVTRTSAFVELVKAHTNREVFPGGDRFWQSVCEEALANYLYQNAEVPADHWLRVEEYTTGLRRFVESILEHAAQSAATESL